MASATAVAVDPGAGTTPVPVPSANAVVSTQATAAVPAASTVSAAPTAPSGAAVPVAPTMTRIAVAATPEAAVPLAINLGQTAPSGKTLAAGDWSIQGVQLTFQGTATTGQALIPQVEVVPVGQQFSGTMTAAGSSQVTGASAVNAVVPLSGLAPGQYHWQARFEDVETKQFGAWVPYAGGNVAFGVVSQAPSLQQVTVTGVTHTASGVPTAGSSDQPALQWSVADDVPASLDHVAYVADQQPQAPTSIPTGATALPANQTTAPISNLGNGEWYLHLWALDKAGQISAPATVALAFEQSAPTISDVLFRSWATNPLYQTVSISFGISQTDSVDVAILPDTSTTPLRNYHLGSQPPGTVHVAWDGKDDQGKIVPAGTYRFSLTVTDDVGNQANALYSGLTITNKVIKVSLSQETLTAYDGETVFATTVVTTGGQALPTKPGQFEVQEKDTPFLFHSPYPKGSPFWFADIKSNMAMLFDPADANFIHDAPWRTQYGPGTDGPGIPGGPKTGSHGCVEVPPAVMARLYPWAPFGTPVIVSP